MMDEDDFQKLMILMEHKSDQHSFGAFVFVLMTGVILGAGTMFLFLLR